MADEFVTRCGVSIDGKDISDFKNYKDEDVELAVQVELMNKTGTAEKTARYKFSIDYVRPTVGAIDFTKIKNSIVIVGLEGGGSYTYRGVKRLTIGGGTVDGESELVRTINFSATDKDEE